MAKPRFRVGDRVNISLVSGKAAGVIAEDRGEIGARGRRLYRVLVLAEPYEPTAYEIPEAEIEPYEEPADLMESLNPDRVASYLKNGGLISILNANRSGGRNQPGVWLCVDSLGNITYTFVKERGVLGGKVVPFDAIFDEHVFRPKRDEVIEFIQSFGLNRAQAEGVVKAVGLRPRRPSHRVAVTPRSS